MNERCLVCREVAGKIDLPGGLLWENAEVIAFHLPPTDGSLGVDHFHQHLYPRYPGVPPGTSWMAVDELPDAPHGTADEIGDFVNRLRVHL